MCFKCPSFVKIILNWSYFFFNSIGWSIFEVYLKYILEVYLKYTSTILEIYVNKLWKYASSMSEVYLKYMLL